MHIEVKPDGSLLLDMTQKQARELAKTVIQHAEDAQTALLNFSYLLNEAHYDAGNQFRQPPHAWEPGAHQPVTK
ncbi:MAG: hypothetical protein ABIT70_06405 [Sulfuriferula sp.]|jgi:hypothetical protein